MGLDKDGNPAIPPFTEDGQRRANIPSITLFNSEASKALNMIFIDALNSLYLMIANANLGQQTPVMIGAWAQGMIRSCMLCHDHPAHSCWHRCTTSPSRTSHMQVGC